MQSHPAACAKSSRLTFYFIFIMLGEIRAGDLFQRNSIQQLIAQKECYNPHSQDLIAHLSFDLFG